MNLKSLTIQTDLIFIKQDGEILDRGNYIAVKSPSKPNFFWGNFLVFPQPPVAGSLANWEKLFKDEFTDPKIYHKTFTWDVEETGDISEFTEAGYNFEKYLALTTTKEQLKLPPKNNNSIEVRPLKNTDDWNEVIDIQVSAANIKFSKEQWRGFYQKQALTYQKMITQNLGLWFGAYLDGKLVASMGLFVEGHLGRFQIVTTHPDFQRQGICGTLVYKVSQYAFENMKVDTLVMVAFEDYHAAKVYESVGFRITEKMYGVCSWRK
jgi:RimJ/RimL family protein N-acetyltransferase